uniref:Uncharacterized protein n=1 Tax=uncultured gamma proteobacterium HF0070_25G02 TaxID=723566 RepID=E7C284_9GAMM|nr:hypothetical protein [uncultured gamma proteobacterium HF0070_25G02]
MASRVIYIFVTELVCQHRLLKVEWIQCFLEDYAQVLRLVGHNLFLD